MTQRLIWTATAFPTSANSLPAPIRRTRHRSRRHARRLGSYLRLNPLADDAAGDLDSDNLVNLDEYTLAPCPTTPIPTTTACRTAGKSSTAPTRWWPTPAWTRWRRPDQCPGTGSRHQSQRCRHRPRRHADGWEVTYGLNPLADDAAGDLDSDNLVNLDEYTLGTLPTTPIPTTTACRTAGKSSTAPTRWWPMPASTPMANGLTNAQELAAGTNPHAADTDHDGMPDGWEVTHAPTRW